MKTRITMLLALLLTLVCVVASAQEYYTLPEIREQAAAGWHETYTDKYGRETIVDIDVEVFGADTAPVLKAGFYEDVEYSVELNHPSEALFDAKKRGGETVYAFELRNEKVDLDKKYGEEYGNDLTLREIYAFAEDILKREVIPSESFLYEQPVTFRVKYSANKNNGDIIVPASFDLEILTKKYEMPILSHASESHLNPGYPCYLPYLMISIRSFDEYRIGGQSLKVLEEVIEDIPFCSVTKTIQSIEERIKSGHIQKVYSLRFGYSVFNEPIFQTEKPMSGYDADYYYLVPAWLLECEFVKNPKKNYNNNGTDKRIITIDAQTGEMIDPFDSSIRGTGNAGYKKPIPWDKVQ